VSIILFISLLIKDTKAMSKSYMNPEIDADSHGSPMDQAIRQHQQEVTDANKRIALSSGQVHTTGGGRTLNIPKTLPVNTIPGPTYNSAVNMGPACQGNHCAIPITPTTTNLISNNLKSSNPPPGANTNYPGTVRMGNNNFSMPGIRQYTGTQVNPGSFHIQCGARDNTSVFDHIYDPSRKQYVDLFSRRGRKVLWRFIRKYD